MKKIKICLLIGLAVLLAAAVLIFVTRSTSDRRFLQQPEDEIYAQVQKLSTEKLIKLINRLEKKIPSYSEKIRLLPLYTALTERAGEFTEDPLIDYIRQEKTGSGIDSAFVRIYAANGYDPEKLASLLEEPSIAEEVKAAIVSEGSYSVSRLCEIFRSRDGEIAQIAFKRIAAQDADAAMILVNELLQSGSPTSDEKYRSICLGIAEYYEDHAASEEADAIREQFAPVLQTLFTENRSPAVRDQAVYAMGRICDPALFSWLMENDSVDFYLKVSVMERNIPNMKVWISQAASESELQSVLDAMRLHPIREIGDALQSAVDVGRLSGSEALTDLIRFIRTEGIAGADKHE